MKLFGRKGRSDQQIHLKKAVERLAIPFPIYFTDPVTLKTILRSNPGVVELKRGVVVSKRSCFELKNED